MSPEASALARLSSLADIAVRSTSFADFERHLRDFLDSLRDFSTRAQVAATIADEPPRLAGRFSNGDAADVRLAVHAEGIASKAGLPVPSWVEARVRVSETRMPMALAVALGIRPGRPSLSREHKRRTNAERQRRFRARRAAEWQRLRGATGRARPSPAPLKPARTDITLDLHSLP